MTDLGSRDRESSGAVFVAKAEELAHGQSLVFELMVDDLRQTGFVLRHGDRLLAYVNRCPHWNVDLDFGDGRMYDERIDRIYCKNHGATFVPQTGLCDFGPCVGSRLQLLDVVVDRDGLWVLGDTAQSPERQASPEHEAPPDSSRR